MIDKIVLKKYRSHCTRYDAAETVGQIHRCSRVSRLHMKRMNRKVKFSCRHLGLAGDAGCEVCDTYRASGRATAVG